MHSKPHGRCNTLAAPSMYAGHKLFISSKPKDVSLYRKRNLFEIVPAFLKQRKHKHISTQYLCYSGRVSTDLIEDFEDKTSEAPPATEALSTEPNRKFPASSASTEISVQLPDKETLAEALLKNQTTPLPVTKQPQFAQTELLKVLSDNSGSNPTSSKSSNVSSAVQSTTSRGSALPAESKKGISDLHKVWALAILTIAYVHQGITSYMIPAMLPMISSDLPLSDFQGAMLTTGYFYLYAIALVPIGLLADSVRRPSLLAVGLAVWSMLSFATSYAQSFSGLLISRVGFAAAQGTQNPVSFSLIPDLFPKHKSTALALYNCGIYIGRALSFAAVLLARHLHENPLAMNFKTQLMEWVRRDKLDSMEVSLVFGSSENNGVPCLPPAHSHEMLGTVAELADPAWRQVLRWIAIPGLFIALAMQLTVPEQREHNSSTSQSQASSSPIPPISRRKTILRLITSPTFLSTTIAAAINDIGCYALIAWQSIFYERVYGLDSSYYAPILAFLLPVSGILGAVGGGFIADFLSTVGGRAWITAGACILSAPFLAVSCMSPSAEGSFVALAIGFALAEAWRAPSAVMAKSVAPPSLGSTASAVYLCIRNLLGGIGPIAVALLAQSVGLQKAMLLIPISMLMSGIGFLFAEHCYENELVSGPPADSFETMDSSDDEEEFVPLEGKLKAA